MRKVRLGDLGQIITGNTPSKNHLEFYESSDIPFIKPDDFESLNSISTSLNHKSYISEKARSKARIIPKQSVLVTCIGIIGKVMISETEVSFNQQINAIIPNNLILAKYLAYQLIFNQNKLNFIANAPVVPIVNKTQFSDFEIQIHDDIKQQKAIVAVLENIDSQIIKRHQQLTKLNTLVKSRFYEMFGDPILNEKNWKKCHLKDIATEKLSYGSGASAVEFSGLRYIRITDIDDNGNLKSDAKSPSSFDEKYLLNDGDILFARSGATVGKTFCYSRQKHGRAIYAGYLIRLVPDFKQVNSTFIYHFTNTKYYDDFISKAQKAVAQPNINAQQYGALDFILPPLTLQNQFADFVAEVDKSQLAIKKSLDELEILKKSLMQAYFG